MTRPQNWSTNNMEGNQTKVAAMAREIKPTAFRKTVVDLAHKCLTMRLNDAQSLGEKNDLLNLMIKAEDAETGAKMRQHKLISEIIIFLVAGHETTAHCKSCRFLTHVTHWYCSDDVVLTAHCAAPWLAKKTSRGSGHSTWSSIACLTSITCDYTHTCLLMTGASEQRVPIVRWLVANDSARYDRQREHATDECRSWWITQVTYWIT